MEIFIDESVEKIKGEHGFAFGAKHRWQRIKLTLKQLFFAAAEYRQRRSSTAMTGPLPGVKRAGASSAVNNPVYRRQGTGIF
jgi:hypothetical protein